eukprot:TRINITY_DN5154_c0_g1_i15.p1 TRINITY_DN5154_c0_g1~~TRINITY_DN5154_c0_g1_i15.p1  ORF type:complete len:158 (+),score=24.71 TRINITY_DN5154_c0_g1_i15:48-476(+)
MCIRDRVSTQSTWEAVVSTQSTWDKSIIRHTFKHVQKNRKEMVGLLKKEGFEIDEIEVAFKEIAYLAKQESERGKPKNSKKALGKMLESKTIYTYILRESLMVMIESWQNGAKGKVLRENLQTYKEVCQEYYNKITSLVNQS